MISQLLAVECTDGDIRLADGPTIYEGRVELCLHGIWGSVCGSYTWDYLDAAVVCRQYGVEGLGELHLHITSTVC